MRILAILVLVVSHAPAQAANHLVLCRDHLSAPGAALDLLERHVFDRPITYASHEDGALVAAFDKIGLYRTDSHLLRNLILSVWRPKKKGSALIVDLFRLERNTLKRVRQFRLKEIQPQAWRPLQLDDRQAERPYEAVKQMRAPPSPVVNGLSYDHVGYQSEADEDGVRLMISTRYAPSDRSVQITLGLDVPRDLLPGYVFPDTFVARVKDAEGDLFRIGLLTFAADKL